MDRINYENDYHIRELFIEYCEIFGIHPAYGAEDWRIDGDTLWIKQDISARGCYNSEDHYLPAAWAEMGEERTEAMKKAFAEQQEAEKNKKIEDKKRELARLEERVKQLKKELGLTTDSE